MTFTYPEVGATQGGTLPSGYNHLCVRVRLRTRDLRAAADAVCTFAVHRGSGARVTADAETAAPGVSVRIGLGLGPFRIEAPCRVIWVADEPDRAGFGYGTLAGHPECGEESFMVERAADGSLEFVVTAFSRPAAWYTRVAGPLVPVVQRLYARHLGRVLNRLLP
jgi:uncharacterized protein (UPF0548 family)